MIINLTEQKVLNLIINYDINIEDIAISERKNFLENQGSNLLLHYFKQNHSSEVAKILNYEPIEDLFMKEIRSFNNLADINYIESLPENSFITYFIGWMSKQNALDKENCFDKIYPLLTKYKEDFKKFFNIRLGEDKSSFPKGQPIGLFFLRVFDKPIDTLLDSGVISVDLFSPITNDTLAHYLSQYSFNVSKSIIDKIENLTYFLQDKNQLGKTGIDKLMSDLRERNIQTIEYLFSQKIDISIFQNEFFSYVIKGSNVLKNIQTRNIVKENILKSFTVLFSLPQIQNNVELKQSLAKKIAQHAPIEIQYLWLNAKLPPKGIEEKRLKI